MIYKENTVFDEALNRIRMLYDTHEDIIVSMSGGKDSAVVLVSYINPMFEFVDTELGPDFPFDDGIYSWWAKKEMIYIASTIPSTVQHLCPMQSTLGYNNKNKVTKVWAGPDLSEVNWEANKFTFSQSMPISVSLEKTKQMIAEGKIKSNPFTIFRDTGGNVF